jgi:hypothetical protein
MSDPKDQQDLNEISDLPFPERARALAQLVDELEERLESLDGGHAPTDEDERSPRR